MVEVDARGFSCPRPVMMTEEEIKKGTTEFYVLVDNRVAENNVTKYAKAEGFNVINDREGRDFKIIITK